ncbi:beta-N-acetylhexosaminidase [Pedobacter sp. MC2016-24]|uniref:beta-N-acetylhexosaminidase n=1 Tax=Pedobacter sp. MC2016-24 TaxID=2780090 RepID=UPI00187E6D5A|nr:family 20 glycosylhydrolase [Pedobacter sp. MC2016-24]MBE9601041.1 family 20 glycosylhydrolase [Pedobacter sp. MC2016-24]
MKKIFLFAMLCLVISVHAQHRPLNLIPEPAHVAVQSGHFVLKTGMFITCPDTADLGLAKLLASQLKSIGTGGLETAVASEKKGKIKLLRGLLPGAAGHAEGYQLIVNPKEIQILAAQPAGWFYGMQTLLQILQANYKNGQKQLIFGQEIPCLTITDYPRFQWRGLMIDVSRNFFTRDVIERYIDQMAKYKMNTLHLHLTDNQGWRVEIKALPKLTGVGAWRVPRTGYWRGQKAPEPGEKATLGGYYTAEDIKHMVAYAARRFVDIVPEIDVPGHSLALIASYPELSCTKTVQQVLAGDPWNASRTNVLCVGNDSVYVVLDQIIGEMAGMFPSKYIHIGGDEVSRAYWDKCESCQKRIRDEHLKSSEELQSYFIKRVAKIVLSKGKIPMGWYEKLPGGLPVEMALMSWKDDKGGIASSNKGHKVVMTPAAFTYLDFYQGDPFMENAIFSVNRLSTTYQFDPLPAGIDQKNVLGGQGSLWTEQVPNERKLQFMTWPRAFSLSQTLWSAAPKPSFPDFVKRIEAHLPRLDRDTVNYSRYFYDAIVSGLRAADKTLQVKLAAELEDLKIYYSFDDTDPDQYYPMYKGMPLDIPKGAQNLRVVTYRDGKVMGRILKIPVTELERRTP